MSFFHKISLYGHTLRYLKWTQIWHRVTFKLIHPKPDFSPAPSLTKITAKTAFPRMPESFVGPDRFRFLNEEQPFEGWNDAKRDKLWLYNLHYFDWLRQENISAGEGERWLSRWIAENPPPAGNGWEPYPLSLRIVNWIKWHWDGHPLSAAALQSLAVQTRFLMQRLEYHLLANHLLANAKALVFAGRFFSGPEAETWLNKGLEIYRKQLPEQILADGGHFELSPMYHSIILEDLLDLKNIGAPLELNGYIQRMLHWLAVMTGPDGGIALFNDAAHGIAFAPDAICDYGVRLGFPKETVSGSEDLPQSGYSRLQQGDGVCICDTGEISPSYQPGHAHADALSFELWLNGKKVLTNCGTGRYFNSPERRFQRSSAAHNTLAVDGKNSSEIWSAHRVARRGKVLERSFAPGTAFGRFLTWNGAILERTFSLSDGKLEILDRVSASGKHRLVQWFHGPEMEKLDMSFEPEGNVQKGTVCYSPGFGIFSKLTERIHICSFKNKINVQIIIRGREK